MRKASIAFLVVACVGVAAAVIVGTRDSPLPLAATLGVVPQEVAVSIPPGQQACQTPIDLSASFASVQINVGTYRHLGPPLTVITRRVGQPVVLSVGRLSSGYPDNSTQTVQVKPVGGGQRVAVCIVNRGRRALALYGGPALAARTSRATLDGKNLGTDISLVFFRRHHVQLLATLPSTFRRAALFHAAWVGPWTFWLLGAAFILLVPLLLASGLRDSEPQ
jgi:hypothetical protein